MLRIALLATVAGVDPCAVREERILLHRIGPSQSTLFIANTDGSDERPLLHNSGFDYNASLSADGKWIIFTSERGGRTDSVTRMPEPLWDTRTRFLKMDADSQRIWASY